METLNKDLLKEAREETHKVVQLVAMVPRFLLEPDPTDSSASLIWDSRLHQLVSQNIQGLVAGFEFINQEIQLIRDGRVTAQIPTIGHSYEQVFIALKQALTREHFNGEALHADLPYALPDSVVRRGTPFKKQNDQALSKLSGLYNLSADVLEDLFDVVKEASEIRCWPHHYDLATLVTLEAHEDPEKAKSIGFGFSPGDGSYDEPYFYLTPWPYPDKDQLYEMRSPAFWNTEGWTGGILKATDLSTGNEKETIINYFKEGLEKLKLIV